MYRQIYFVVALFGALAIFLGAFSAHGLEHDLSAQESNMLQTAARYHMWHVLACLALIAMDFNAKKKKFMIPVYFFLAGIILFSGSLYILSIDQLFNIQSYTSWLGPVTPIGGLTFIIGWLVLAFKLSKKTA